VTGARGVFVSAVRTLEPEIDDGTFVAGTFDSAIRENTLVPVLCVR
jgi:hypothetical protein